MRDTGQGHVTGHVTLNFSNVFYILQGMNGFGLSRTVFATQTMVYGYSTFRIKMPIYKLVHTSCKRPTSILPTEKSWKQTSVVFILIAVNCSHLLHTVVSPWMRYSYNKHKIIINISSHLLNSHWSFERSSGLWLYKLICLLYVYIVCTFLLFIFSLPVIHWTEHQSTACFD